MIRVPAQTATISHRDGDLVIALEFDRQQLQRLLACDDHIRLCTGAAVLDLRLSDDVRAG